MVPDSRVEGPAGSQPIYPLCAGTPGRSLSHLDDSLSVALPDDALAAAVASRHTEGPA